jgi:hypothetical protein
MDLHTRKIPLPYIFKYLGETVDLKHIQPDLPWLPFFPDAQKQNSSRK